MSDIAIKIEDVKKQYRLGAIGGGTLSADLESWWAKKHGKEDPNVKIGVDQKKLGETFYALNGINLEVKKGETLGIIGANGAGKSTLLKILSRVTAPTEGRIGINGRITSMLEVGTGFHPELTGRENIYMNGTILGMTKKEIDSKIDDIIEFSECRQFIDTPVKRYSSGMYVKLGFSVASYLESEIMIMDEVLAVGDVKFQQKCLNSMLHSSKCDNRTILYVSHNMATIKQLCDRCIVLNKGKIVFNGDTSEAINVYLGRDIYENKKYIDLSQVQRKSNEYGKKIKIRGFEFLNGDDAGAAYMQGTKARCRIDWDIQEDIDNFQIQIVIVDIDFSPVCVMHSEMLSLKADRNSIGADFEFDFSNFCVGKYSFILNCIHVNEYGGVTSYDQPYEYISFEICENGKSYQTAWNRKTMGSVKLNAIRMLPLG